MGAELTFPCTWVKHLPTLLRNIVNSQKQPSIYEDRRSKSTEDIEKTEGKGIASGQKFPGTSTGTRAAVAPGPPLLQDSWERARLRDPPLPNKA